MIPRPHIAKWQDHAPWLEFSQIEQDLVISRILVELFSDEYLHENLAFRGGTAHHKLYLNPAPRYSEDIDLVQVKRGPIKAIMRRIDEVISFFEEPRKTEVRGHGSKVLYRFTSEYEAIRLRLKLEINCKEHFNVYDWSQLLFEVNNDWFTGTATIKTYQVNELLGTKLRALYQRSKGRDLFDLFYSRTHPQFDPDQIVHCFKEYTKFSTKKLPAKQDVLSNIEAKAVDPNFAGDLEGLLRSDIKYEQEIAVEWIKSELISRL